ncbi:unnamed protein product [Paramecium primaurelia]|uniref:Uncharacterized protein n=1 Tax=Paramecium primaurelia TaxID=5886 RepID=A0A8S1QHN2_PARPR|nr:unnamed protein product [Paramecium primaurelia]
MRLNSKINLVKLMQLSDQPIQHQFINAQSSLFWIFIIRNYANQHQKYLVITFSILLCHLIKQKMLKEGYFSNMIKLLQHNQMKLNKQLKQLS